MVEIELKLALPGADPAHVTQHLEQLSALALEKPTHQPLHNIYYDTPAQTLHHQRLALRVRRIGNGSQPQWLQTFKISDGHNSALSHRGEWEAAIPKGELDFNLLAATPWAKRDPDGSLFQKLRPCFATTFKRTSWVVHQGDGGTVEVSLDVGQIQADDMKAPICELELELKAGEPAVLFQLAQQIARTLSVLPLHTSKAERGYALAQNTLYAPVPAQPAALKSSGSLPNLAQLVLREMYGQFCANLHTLLRSDDPEVVHQARVGWRRFKSGLRFFKPVLPLSAAVSLEALQPLLGRLGALRNLDVARLETLPPLAHAYTEGNSQRQDHWQALQQALTKEADNQRNAVRTAIGDPELGATLLTLTQWLEEPCTAVSQHPAQKESQKTQRQWIQHRMTRLHQQLEHALQDANNPIGQHRSRILAKRMRYNIEALRPWLPKQRTHRWYQQAKDLQTTIGAQRDRQQALEIVSHLPIDPGICDFLRGIVAATH